MSWLAEKQSRRRARIEPLAYRIEYGENTLRHLEALTAAPQALVHTKIGEQLRHQPTVETRNRKPLRPNELAPWELRIRNLRVFFRVDEAPEQVVWIVAVGVKVRNRILIANQEITL